MPRGKGVILSARVGRNADSFADIAALYIPDGADVLDATYGRGNFWRKDVRDRVRLTTNDIITDADTHFDFYALPFPDESFDVVVFDPPYAPRPGATSRLADRKAYPYELAATAPKTKAEVAQQYIKAAPGFARILRPRGIYIAKCQDDTDCWNHVTIINETAGFRLEDLFIVVQPTQPVYRGDLTQRRARKNHSYFLIFRKTAR